MMEPGYTQAHDNVQYLLDKLTVTEQQIDEAETATRGQRDNPMWGILRKGRLTASNFGPVIKTIHSGRSPSKSLMRTLLGEYDLSELKAIQWGCTHEAIAIKASENLTGKSVSPSGIWLSSSGCLGASLDGLVGDSIIEVKCPFSLREKSAFEQISDLNFFVGLNEDDACLASL